MMGKRRSWPALALAALALCVAAPAARGASSDPLFVFTPVPTTFDHRPLPNGYLYGPCGLGADPAGNFYIADYYHHAVDVYSGTANYLTGAFGQGVTGSTGYITQLANEDPLDGPCGLAIDSTGKLYVNNFHRNVAKFNASPSFGAGTILAGADGANDPSAHSTGVAVDASNNVYVDERTYVQEYDSSGNPVAQIGLDPSADYYGLAVSAFPGSGSSASTQGFLYVPDAATNTVKVFDPTTSLTTPITQINNPSNQPFTSLRDAAVAVDRLTGDVYVADNTQPLYTERPQATIYIYRPASVSPNYTYKGHLKYNVTDALPLGLAVDNSAQATQGRVYVTSGNTEPASIYAYAPGSATSATPLAPIGNAADAGASGSSSGQGGGDPGAAPDQGTSLPDSASAPSIAAPSIATPDPVTPAVPPHRAKHRRHRVLRHHHRRHHRKPHRKRR